MRWLYHDCLGDLCTIFRTVNIPAKICTVKRSSLCSTLHTNYYSSFINLLMLVTNQMICWLLTAFFTSIQLSFSVARYMAACTLRACLSICLYLSWSHVFWTKINKICKREFLRVSKETSPILNSRTWTSNMPYR